MFKYRPKFGCVHMSRMCEFTYALCVLELINSYRRGPLVLLVQSLDSKEGP